MVDGKTAVCGLIGNPVEHTLSPVIHNTLARMTGENLIYVPFRVEKERVEDALKGAFALNVLGLNVTVPHKSEVLPYLDGVDEEAAMIGAVNTLVRTEKGYRGYNTDLPGLYRALLSEGIQVEGEEILLLGAGGASRAAAFLCAKKGAKKVYLLNRSLERAQAVANEVNSVMRQECIRPMPLAAWGELTGRRYLAIQGTSVGLAPDTEKAVIEDARFYELIHTGFDLIYRPAETKFMRLVRMAGGKTAGGLKMLLYQGVESYERWTGKKITEEQALACYEQMEKELERNEC